MATNDTELVEEIRALTEYSESRISDDEMQALVDIAKEELDADVSSGSSVSYFGDETHNADRALFWLSCLFAKIRAGEIAAPSFTIDDLRSSPLDGQSNFWLMMYRTRARQISGAQGYGQTSVARDDRSYDFDAP